MRKEFYIVIQYEGIKSSIKSSTWIWWILSANIIKLKRHEKHVQIFVPYKKNKWLTP